MKQCLHQGKIEMRGNKPTNATILKDWGWAYPTYTFSVSKEIKSVQIDKTGFMADVDMTNNQYPK